MLVNAELIFDLLFIFFLSFFFFFEEGGGGGGCLHVIKTGIKFPQEFALYREEHFSSFTS